MSLNGGLKNTESKKLDSSLQIIGDTPEMTEDIKKTIEYLENIVINKQTLAQLNTGELVRQINRLIQYVEVLSIYKRPTFNLIKMYEETSAKCRNEFLPKKKQQILQQKKEILEELIDDSQLNNSKINRKDYWENYE